MNGLAHVIFGQTDVLAAIFYLDVGDVQVSSCFASSRNHLADCYSN